MNVLLDQLLDVSRMMFGKLQIAQERVDLADVIAAAVEAAAPAIDELGQRLEVSKPGTGEVLVRGDVTRLTQIVDNLLSNASKYTEHGGRIWLTVEAQDGWAKLAVKDTGIGIEPDLLPHVFDVFTQGPPSPGRATSGLGLGLSLVRLLADLHGGRVEAFSEGPGRGSEFVLHLPRLVDSDEASEGASPPAQPDVAARRQGPSRRVLVVDDEQDAATMLGEILDSRGHLVQVVHRGIDALEVVDRFRPQLVLLDIGLPDLEGYEVAKQLRAHYDGELTLIALTGYRADHRRLNEAGFDNHLLKPPDLDQILRLVEGPAS